MGHEPLTKNTKENFYIPELFQEGFDVEYWDVSKIVHDELQIIDELSETYLRKIITIESFKKLVSQYSSDSIFLVEIFETWSARSIFKVLSDFQVISIRIDTYATAIVPLKLKHKLVYLRSVSYLRKVIKQRLLNWRLKQFYNRNNIVKYNILFTSANLPTTRETEVVRINSKDYEKYLEEINLINMFPGERYCVFLDEYLPFHPDTVYILKGKRVNPETYFSLMNRLFDYIEHTMNIRVVIAGHPKSDYSSETFNSRPIIKYKTNQLVKFSEFVIVHTSLSLHFAVLNYKPIIFTAYEELKKCSISKFAIIKYRASFLNRPIHMLDDLHTLNILPVDKDKYDLFRYQFLSSPETANVRNKDIILQRIKKEAKYQHKN